MSALGTIFAMFCGSLAGSYAGALSYRLVNKHSPWEKSRCPACSHSLGFFDQVPVLGYLALRGRCRYCGSKVSLRYIVVEIAGAVLAVLAWLKCGPSVPWLAFLVLESFLLAAVLTDLESLTIPDGICLRVALAGVIFAIARHFLLDALAGAAVAGLPLLVMALIRPEGMGGGDVKLAAAAGLFLGPLGAAYAMLFASAGAILFGVLRRAVRKVPFKAVFPFGPFLAGAVMLQFLFVGGAMSSCVSQIW